LKLEVKTLADGPTLYTDRNRLGEILNQYVNNAIKFTEKGSVTIGYDVKDNTLRLWVRDTGIGIPAEHCDEHLFERFVKVNDFVPGTGLGLSICRSLAQSIDARVGMESKYGEGSQFWVELAIG
jgi:signal transduction histidine kinase